MKSYLISYSTAPSAKSSPTSISYISFLSELTYLKIFMESIQIFSYIDSFLERHPRNLPLNQISNYFHWLIAYLI